MIIKDEKDARNAIPDNVRKAMELRDAAANRTPPVRHVNLGEPPNGALRPPQLPNQREDRVNLDDATKAYGEKMQMDRHTPNRQAPAAPDERYEEVVAAPLKQEETKPRPPFPKSELGPEWRRIDFPSNLVPYPGVEELYLRPFEVLDLEAIYDSIETENHTGYLDALDQCISMDVRDLTVPDFIFMQYWMRMSSYPRSPYTVTWTSRYGNDIKQKLAPPELQLIYLNMTREEYADWYKRGICFPTVRESEFIINSSPAPDPTNGKRDTTRETWAMQNAQYVRLDADAPVTDRMRQKMLKLRTSKDIDILTDIQNFAIASEHGVVENITSVDPNFEPKSGASFLRKSAEQLRTLARGVADENAGIEQTAGLLQLIQAADGYDEEATEIEAALEKGVAYKPRKENIALRSITPMDMFPVAYTEAAA